MIIATDSLLTENEKTKKKEIIVKRNKEERNYFKERNGG